MSIVTVADFVTGHYPEVQGDEKRRTAADRLQRIPRQGGSAAERHPPGARHPGANEDTNGHRGSDVGGRLGHHRQDLRLHQPHRIA